MANHFWLCPTKKTDIFYNISVFVKFLNDNIKEYIFEAEESDTTGILVRKCVPHSKLAEYIFTIFAYSPYDADKDEIIKFADQEFGEDKGDELIVFFESVKIDFERCIELRHEFGEIWNDQKYITKMIQWHFGAVWIDEGIYPEVILPPKEDPSTQVSKKGFIKKFKDWIRVRC